MVTNEQVTVLHDEKSELKIIVQ